MRINPGDEYIDIVYGDMTIDQILEKVRAEFLPEITSFRIDLYPGKLRSFQVHAVAPPLTPPPT